MAPPAAQAAAFEKYRGTDSRPIVQRESLDVEYDAAAHVRFSFLINKIRQIISF
jgi:hypothetical protein